jgi:hypothetical protein
LPPNVLRTAMGASFANDDNIESYYRRRLEHGEPSWPVWSAALHWCRCCPALFDWILGSRQPEKLARRQQV